MSGVRFLEAGGALGSFDSRKWLPELNVPTGVVMSPPQIVLCRHDDNEQCLASFPTARTWTVDGDHDAVFARADVFVPALLEAIHFVHHESVRRRATTS
jgi:3',5'-cyclic AMP phosphodiesterase CpdA